jgi:hypothetical protein
MGATMKTVEIMPRNKSAIYSGLVKKEAAIRKNGRGTFVRKGPMRGGAATWNHKKFKGSVNLKHEPAELVRAKIRSGSAEDELGLLRSFLGFVDRYFNDQVATITIHYD